MRCPAILAALLTLALAVGAAWGQLCARCRDLGFIADVGACTACGADTASSALKLCPACSRGRNACAHCLAPLAAAPASAAATAPATAAAEGPLVITVLPTAEGVVFVVEEQEFSNAVKLAGRLERQADKSRPVRVEAATASVPWSRVVEACEAARAAGLRSVSVAVPPPAPAATSPATASAPAETATASAPSPADLAATGRLLEEAIGGAWQVSAPGASAATQPRWPAPTPDLPPFLVTTAAPRDGSSGAFLLVSEAAPPAQRAALLAAAARASVPYELLGRNAHWVLLTAGGKATPPAEALARMLSLQSTPYSLAALGAALRIEGDLELFSLNLRYLGPADKPFVQVTLLVPEPEGPERPFWPVVRLSTDQAHRLVEGLLAEGFFDRAIDIAAKAMPRPSVPSYTCWVSGGRDEGRYQFYEDLGFNAATVRRLAALRPSLEGPAADALDKLLDRIAFLTDAPGR